MMSVMSLYITLKCMSAFFLAVIVSVSRCRCSGSVEEDGECRDDRHNQEQRQEDAIENHGDQNPLVASARCRVIARLLLLRAQLAVDFSEEFFRRFHRFLRCASLAVLHREDGASVLVVDVVLDHVLHEAVHFDVAVRREFVVFAGMHENLGRVCLKVDSS